MCVRACVRACAFLCGLAVDLRRRYSERGKASERATEGVARRGRSGLNRVEGREGVKREELTTKRRNGGRALGVWACF